LFITIPIRPRPMDDSWHKLGKNSTEWAIIGDLWHYREGHFRDEPHKDRVGASLKPLTSF
jgi:hypothetical protein